MALGAGAGMGPDRPAGHGLRPKVPLKKGYEGDIEKLWESAQKQNTEAASTKRLELLINAQRHQVAHHAGERWRPLMAYLSGTLRQLPED